VNQNESAVGISDSGFIERAKDLERTFQGILKTDDR
jgi:hypothetical protein